VDLCCVVERDRDSDGLIDTEMELKRFIEIGIETRTDSNRGLRRQIVIEGSAVVI
jgi:hypothetical protein